MKEKCRVEELNETCVKLDWLNFFEFQVSCQKGVSAADFTSQVPIID